MFPHLALYVSDDAAYPSVTASLHKLRIEMATFGLLESGALPELTAGAIWVVDDPQCVELLPEIDR